MIWFKSKMISLATRIPFEYWEKSVLSKARNLCLEIDTTILYTVFIITKNAKIFSSENKFL